MIETVVIKGVTIRIDGLREHEGETMAHTFTETRRVHGVVEQRVFEESVNIRSSYFDIMVRTLELLPESHLSDVVAMNIIKIRPNLRVGGGSGQDGYIYISPFSLDNRYNRVHNQTLLHEIGHKVDHHYHAVDNMTALRQNFLRHVHHDGGTQSASEAYGDCYMDYFHRGVSAFSGGFSHQAHGVTFDHHGETITYNSQQINEERLAAFLSVAPMHAA